MAKNRIQKILANIYLILALQFHVQDHISCFNNFSNASVIHCKVKFRNNSQVGITQEVEDVVTIRVYPVLKL